MNFGHFSTQNTSVKVEISNQVKCHTAQRSEARGGRTGLEAGRKMSRPPLKLQTRRAREVEGRPLGRMGVRLRATPGEAKSYRSQGEALEKGSESRAPSGASRGPQASAADQPAPRDPPRFAGQEGAGGSFLSSLSPRGFL